MTYKCVDFNNNIRQLITASRTDINNVVDFGLSIAKRRQVIVKHEVETNYRQIKQDIVQIIESEIE